MEIVDFCQYFGLEIDREENNARRVRQLTGRFFTRGSDNFKLYMPEIKGYGDVLKVTFELIVKVETNLKLDLIDKQGNRLVSFPDENEIHYVQFEAVVDEITVSLS